MGSIRFEGTCFNLEWVSSFTSVSDFISACSVKSFLQGENRETKLAELYTIVNGKPKTKSKSKEVLDVQEETTDAE